jgi:hypothetical protein
MFRSYVPLSLTARRTASTNQTMQTSHPFQQTGCPVHFCSDRRRPGLLILGLCCAVLTGRWSRTAWSGALAFGLAVVLGIPDGIWGGTRCTSPS